MNEETRIWTRDASPDETGLLMDLTLRCWRGTVAENSSLYRETPEQVGALLASPQGGAVFLMRGENTLGAGRWFAVPGPAGDERAWVEIKRVGLLREARKAGLGPALVEAVEQAARQRLRPAGAQLGVRADQPRLIAFWRGCGYEIADDVRLHAVNPLTPPPTTMRKWFGAG